MRKILYIAASLFFILFTLTDCTKWIGKSDTDTVMSFSPILKNSTKGADSMSFGIWAFQLPQGLDWSTNSEQAEMLFADKKITLVDGKWSTSSEYVWPSKQSITFFAYAPYSYPATFSKTDGITFNNYSSSENVDLYYSDAITDQTSTSDNGNVNLTLSKALCDVDFYFKANLDSKAKIVINKITLDGLYTTGTFHSLPAPSWKLSGTSSEIQLNNGDFTVRGGESFEFASFMAIPQVNQTTITLLADLYEDDDAQPELVSITMVSNAVLNLGTRRVYTLTVDKDRTLSIDDKKYYYN